MIKKSNILFFFLFCAILLTTCKKDNTNGQIPNVYVNFYVYLSDPEFAALNSVGTAVMVTGGVKGIIIYRATWEEFVALDRVSSYQPENLCAVEIDSTGIYAKDPCSESRFSLYTGMPVKGPASAPLKTYRTLFDGVNSLHIFN
mgnify:CR=1 FL=1